MKIDATNLIKKLKELATEDENFFEVGEVY